MLREGINLWKNNLGTWNNLALLRLTFQWKLCTFWATLSHEKSWLKVLIIFHLPVGQNQTRAESCNDCKWNGHGILGQGPLKKWTEHSQEWGVKIFFEFTGTFFKLLKHGHFGINFRFWLVWVELRKSKALSSLNFLQRHEKYQIGSCP